jgi:hypothetical protein
MEAFGLTNREVEILARKLSGLIEMVYSAYPSSINFGPNINSMMKALGEFIEIFAVVDAESTVSNTVTFSREDLFKKIKPFNECNYNKVIYDALIELGKGWTLSRHSELRHRIRFSKPYSIRENAFLSWIFNIVIGIKEETVDYISYPDKEYKYMSFTRDDHDSPTIFELEENCSICSEPVIILRYGSSHEWSVILYCRHVFHVRCLNDWLERQVIKACPICRSTNVFFPTFSNVEYDTTTKFRVKKKKEELSKWLKDDSKENKDYVIEYERDQYDPTFICNVIFDWLDMCLEKCIIWTVVMRHASSTSFEMKLPSLTKKYGNRIHRIRGTEFPLIINYKTTEEYELDYYAVRRCGIEVICDYHCIILRRDSLPSLVKENDLYALNNAVEWTKEMLKLDYDKVRLDKSFQEVASMEMIYKYLAWYLRYSADEKTMGPINIYTGDENAVAMESFYTTKIYKELASIEKPNFKSRNIRFRPFIHPDCSFVLNVVQNSDYRQCIRIRKVFKSNFIFSLPHSITEEVDTAAIFYRWIYKVVCTEAESRDNEFKSNPVESIDLKFLYVSSAGFISRYLSKQEISLPVILVSRRVEEIKQHIDYNNKNWTDFIGHFHDEYQLSCNPCDRSHIVIIEKQDTHIRAEYKAAKKVDLQEVFDFSDHCESPEY